jgi:hypothetical protein
VGAAPVIVAAAAPSVTVPMLKLLAGPAGPVLPVAPVLPLGTTRFSVWLGAVPVIVASAAVALAVGASLFLSWKQVGGYFNINHTEYLETGAAVDRLTPPDALVIAPAFGDTQFLYATNRRGWPIGFEIEDKIKKGADYYVSTSYDDEAKALEQTYTVVEKNKTFILIDLQKKK